MAYFNGIIGDVGSGKTNIMTRYLKRSADVGAPVISNYALIGIKHRLMSFNEFRDLIMTKNERLIRSQVEGAVVGWDELGVGADSYDFMSKDTRSMGEFIAQIRKLHITAFYTVQRFSMIVRRLRIMTGAFILMDDLDKHRMLGIDGKRVKQHRDICAGLFNATMVNDYLEPVGASRVFNGKPYWGMYDTDKIIWA